MEAACTDLENWLARCSEMGSGDDNTLVMYCNADTAAPVAAPAPAAAARGRVAAALPPLPGAALKFGLGTLAAAAVLGVALGAGIFYFAIKSRHAPPPPQTPLSSPLAPLQERPQPGAEPHEAGKPVPPRDGPRAEPKAEPKAEPRPEALPGQPKELSTPAGPGKPQRQEAEPGAVATRPRLRFRRMNGGNERAYGRSSQIDSQSNCLKVAPVAQRRSEQGDRPS